MRNSELQKALADYDRKGRGLNVLPASEMKPIIDAARKVVNGISTPFCSTHNRTVPSQEVTFTGHGEHHSPTEGCHIIQAVIVEAPDGQ